MPADDPGRVLRFFAEGRPHQAKYHVRASGRRRVRHRDHTAWCTTIRRAALDALGRSWPPPEPLFPSGPVVVGIRFWLPRPGSHLGTGRNAGTVRASAPLAPSAKPDLENLIKPVKDALGAFDGGRPIAWRDDAQVVGYDPAPYELYAPPGQPTGVLVAVRALAELPPAW